MSKKQWSELTPDEKIEFLAEQNTALSKKVDTLEAEMNASKEKISQLSEKIDTISVSSEVSEEVKTPADFNTLEFESGKKKYRFTRPTLNLEIKGKFQVFTAEEVSESEELQKLAIKTGTNAIVLVK